MRAVDVQLGKAEAQLPDLRVVHPAAGPRPANPTTCAAPSTTSWTSSVAHLRENVAGAGLTLTEEDLAALDTIGATPGVIP